MKRYFILSVMFLMTVQTVCAQNEKDDFKQFREGMLNDFSSFRNTVLDNYDKYLDGVWTRYATFTGKKRDTFPKPKKAPVADNKPSEPVIQVPVLPEAKPIPMDKKPNVPMKPSPTMRPVKPILPMQMVRVPFYGMEVSLPKVSVIEVNGIKSTEVSMAWAKLKGDKKLEDVLNALKQFVIANGMNGQMTLELVRKYADVLAAEYGSSERILLSQYLMSNMGYDVRLASSEKQLLLLVPYDQYVYEMPYVELGGEMYYYYMDNINPVKEEYMPVYTCDLPKGAKLGEKVTLLFDAPVKINSGKKHTFNLSYGKMSAHGEVDEATMELLRHYPPMDIEAYAKSNILPDVRQSIVEQLRPHIQGMDKLTALNKILHFVQYAFAYQTDDDQHGYEKYYFFEENLYYPRNDCEDRAIFFGYLVKQLLGLNVQVIGYPGHECTGVRLAEQLHVDGYYCDGAFYAISDPTYIGAEVGNCMPKFKAEKPKVNYEY